MLQKHDILCCRRISEVPAKKDHDEQPHGQMALNGRASTCFAPLLVLPSTVSGSPSDISDGAGEFERAGETGRAAAWTDSPERQRRAGGPPH